MYYFIKLSIYTFILSLLFGGTMVFAQEIKNVAPGSSTQEVIANLFNIVIAAGVLLSVVFLAIGGFEYMGSDVVTQKENARKRIVGALLGLLILLGSYLMIYVINPDILNTDPLRNLGSTSNSSGSGGGGSDPTSLLGGNSSLDPNDPNLIIPGQIDHIPRVSCGSSGAIAVIVSSGGRNSRSGCYADMSSCQQEIDNRKTNPSYDPSSTTFTCSPVQQGN